MSGSRLLRVLRARRAEDLSDPALRRGHIAWSLTALLLSSLLISVTSLLLAVGSFGIPLFFSYFRHPLIVLLNTLPVLLLQTLLFCAFGRQWLAFLLTAVVILGASVGNLFKLRFRYEPFMFSDLSAISAALGVAHNYDLRPNARILFAAGAALAAVLLLFFFARGRWSRKARLLTALGCLLCLWPLWRVCADGEVYERLTHNEDIIETTGDAEVFVTKGFVYPFLHSIRQSASLPPEGYDADRAAALLSEYEDAAIPEERKVNVMIFQLESFKDIRLWGESIRGVDPETYAVWDALKEESYHGVLAVNNFAGGTANTERCVMAGARDMLSPKKPVPSYIRYLNSQGYHTLGDHPYFCYYYDRINANERLGFQGYRYFEDYYGEVYGEPTSFENSDGVFFREVLKEYRELEAKGEDVFAFHVTLQGHYPYRPDEAYYSGFVPEGIYPEHLWYALNNYLGMMHDTQKCIAGLLEELREDETPVVLMFYGDHCPYFGDADFVTGEMGVDLDCAHFQGFLNTFSTEYVIWANDAARAKLGRDFRGEGPTVSACWLMNVLFDQLGWQGSSFMQFARQTQAVLPVVNAGGYYVENGAYTTRLDEEGKQALLDFDSVSYYASSHFEGDRP